MPAAWLQLVSVAALLGPAPAAQGPVREREALSMGTRLRLTVRGASAEALDGALAEADRIEAACSTWRPDSAWSRLGAARGEAVPLDPEWRELLATARAWSERTGGAFDPGVAPLLRAWGAREGGRTPSEAELAAAREASGIRHLVLDPAAGTARLDHPGAAVDEGAFVKGYALDRMAAQLKRGGARAGLLDFGGQLLAFGAPRTAEIADPARRDRARVRLRLSGASLSTSGCSERGRHIVDPRSGRPCEPWGSASVVAPTGLEADILSTALFVMGPEAGAAWAEREGVAALFLPNAGPARATRAFRALHPAFLPEPR